ncbi:MAG TPA: hypothetical protein VL025_05685, partial [Thermoanaerobaculia bacterium]|nr:hypothetical protein [Thermoanaerobaculia bacterium]
MNAVISGAAGVALILDSGQSCILRVEAMDEPMPIRVEDQRYWFGDARDFQFLQGVTIPEIRRRLAEARDHDDALHLVLGLLDPELTDETRRALASELEDLLQVESVRTFLENV